MKHFGEKSGTGLRYHSVETLNGSLNTLCIFYGLTNKTPTILGRIPRGCGYPALARVIRKGVFYQQLIDLDSVSPNGRVHYHALITNTLLFERFSSCVAKPIGA